jgi:rfaE bifunctional protein nucleotidyltransferase chain/domain
VLASVESLGIRQGMVVVLALGCFDPLHFGHVRYLRAAKRLGTHLLVAVTADEYVNKPGRPVFNARDRASMVAELRCVDGVFISDGWKDAIELVRPHVYCKGVEYRGRLPEQEYVESYGGTVHFIDEPTYSSTALLSGAMLKAKSLGGG